MARHAYFADLPGGAVLEWRDTVEATGDLDLFGNPRRRDVPAKVSHDGRRHHGFHNGQWVPITRVIELKPFPSRHRCDARCTNAKGSNCECACGGRNHGRARVMRCVAA